MSVSLAISDGGGTGMPLVLLPSLGSDRSMWRPQRALAGSHRLVVVETWGHGASPTASAPHTLGALGEDVLRALDDAGIERFDLAGISLGGQLALWIAAHHPDRVRRLVAGATAARIGTPAGWDQRIATVREGGMEAVADLAISRLFSARMAQWEPGVVREARDVLLATDPDGYIACCTALRGADLTGSLGAITAPTLLLAGAHDVSTPPSQLEAIAQRIDGAAVRVLDAGHLLNLEAPEAFNAVVAGHLAECSVPRENPEAP